jgi:hypothetical protein
MHLRSVSRDSENGSRCAFRVFFFGFPKETRMQRAESGRRDTDPVGQDTGKTPLDGRARVTLARIRTAYWGG